MPRPKHDIDPLWAHALLIDIWRVQRKSKSEFTKMDQLTPLTPPIIGALHSFQNGRCAISGDVMVIPGSDLLTAKSGLNKWRNTLPPVYKGLTPWLVQLDRTVDLAPSNILLISYKWRDICKYSHSFENALSAIRNIVPIERYPSVYELSMLALKAGGDDDD